MVKIISHDVLTQKFFDYLENSAATEYSIPESQDLSQFYNYHGRDTFELMVENLELVMEPLWTWKKKEFEDDVFYSDMTIHYRRAELAVSHATFRNMRKNKFIISLSLILLNGERIKKYYFIPDNWHDVEALIIGLKVLECSDTRKKLIEVITFLNHTFSQYQTQ